MEKIEWSLRASKDIQIIYQYIALDSKFHANKWLQKVSERINILPTQPNIGRVIPERNNQHFRELIEGNYRIMYKVSDRSIIIYRIMHASRNFK